MTIKNFCVENNIKFKLACRIIKKSDYVIQNGESVLTDSGEKKLREKFNIKKKRTKKTDAQLSLV